MKSLKGNAKVVHAALAVLVIVSISGQRQAQAGWTGLINGLGKGWSGVYVRSSTSQSNYVCTLTNTASPSSTIPPTAGYQTNAPLPGGAVVSTYARIKGLPGGVWSPGLNAVNSGDGTDGTLEFESRIQLTPAECASLTMDTMINQSQSQFESNGFNGTITVNAQATAGTALWLRGFEFTGDMADVPADDPSTVPNESIEYLKLHGVQKFDLLLLGPFEFGTNGACPLIIPFGLPSGKLENLVFATDGVAKSLPMVLNCPSNIVVNCGQPVTYAGVSYAACGDVSFTYNPPAGTAFPVGITPVTVTMSDTNGNSTNCTFTVTVVDNSTPVVPTLATLTGQCSVTVPTPKATNICGITTNVVTGTTSDPLTYTSQGTNVVHWSFSNGNGNVATANQTVIVKDTIPPVVPLLTTVTSSCTASVTLTPPIATDNCSGSVTGATTTVFPITASGTTPVVWRFSDGNGNTSTATQNVVIAGLTFKGFYSPIGTVSNACTGSTLVTANQGSVVPIKFDMLCGTTPITSGTPPVVKVELYNNCQFVSEPISVNAVYNNDWHYNWDTTGWAKGTYRVVVILPDGSSRYVFVKLK